MLTIEEVYQARRDTQARALDLRRTKIFEEHPHLEELYRQINLHQIFHAKNQILGKEDQEVALKLKEYQNLRDEYMRNHGISKEELRLKFFCEHCQDRGFVDGPEGIGKCACMLKIQEGLRYGQAHLSKRIEKENFDNFDLTLFDHKKKYEFIEGSGVFRTERENILAIRRASELFIERFDEPSTKSLFFYGKVGLGKSFMCSCIAKALFDKGKTVLYFTMSELIDILQLYNFDRELFFERYTMEDYFALERSDLLILDDLGAELTNSFVKTALFNIINARMINQKKMVISTNLTPDEVMERYDERISSRLIEYAEFYEFFGENKRW